MPKRPGALKFCNWGDSSLLTKNTGHMERALECEFWQPDSGLLTGATEKISAASCGQGGVSAGVVLRYSGFRKDIHADLNGGDAGVASAV